MSLSERRGERSQLLINSRINDRRVPNNETRIIIEESPLMPSRREPDSPRPDSRLENDETELLTTGDRASVLYNLERVVHTLKEQTSRDSSELRENPLLPIWLTNHILLITFFIQVVGIGVLEIFHTIQTDKENRTTQRDNLIFYTGGGIICVFEAAHLLLVVIVSFKLVKQVLHHTASGSFLSQCYLSTVLLFAGIYTVEFRFNKDAWEKVHADEGTHPLFIYLRMLYFSVSTATLCGTSSVEPLEWYSFSTAALQMLLSFVYFTSILSMAIVPRKSSKYKSRSSKEKSFTKYLRACASSSCFS